MKLVATCLFGLEKLLGSEIDALGLRRIETMDGRVIFEGEPRDIPRANIALRCAERVYILLGSFPARSFAELFDGTRALPFEDWIGKEDLFPVKGHAIKSKLYSLPDCQSIVKKAVVERLSEKYGCRWFSESSGVKYQIEFFIFKDEAYLMIDTSGVALHKRGYRPEMVAAPLRETLAAALAAFSRPREDVLFCDPFCGSGTIAIESAMQMLRIAPGMNRSFAAEAFPAFQSDLWQYARDEARANIITDSTFEVQASDIDPECVRIATESAKRAGVDSHVICRQANALDITSDGRKGTIVTNPPYGERIMERKEAEDLYRAFGKAWDKFPDTWKLFLLSSQYQPLLCILPRIDLRGRRRGVH